MFGALILSITGRSVNHKTWASLRLPNRVYLKKDSHRQLQDRIILLPPRGCEWVNVSSGTDWLTWVVLDKGPLTGSVCVCAVKNIHDLRVYTTCTCSCVSVWQVLPQQVCVWPVVKVDWRIRWHYTTTILRLRIGAWLTRYQNCKFHNFARTISRHADGISRYSVPPSADPLLPLCTTCTCVRPWGGR